jgi:hypothetical protein
MLSARGARRRCSQIRPCPPSGGARRGDGWSAKSRATSRSCRRKKDIRIGPSSKSPGMTKTKAAGFRWEHSLDSSIHANPRQSPGLSYRSWTDAARRSRPVGFRTFTKPSCAKLATGYGRRSGRRRRADVRQSLAELSVDGGTTSTDLDFTKILLRTPSTGLGW